MLLCSEITVKNVATSTASTGVGRPTTRTIALYRIGACCLMKAVSCARENISIRNEMKGLWEWCMKTRFRIRKIRNTPWTREHEAWFLENNLPPSLGRRRTTRSALHRTRKVRQPKGSHLSLREEVVPHTARGHKKNTNYGIYNYRGGLANKRPAVRVNLYYAHARSYTIAYLFGVADHNKACQLPILLGLVHPILMGGHGPTH